MDRESFVCRVGRGALRHGPREQHAVGLEAEVPMKVPGGVLLNHEEPAAG